MASRDRILTLCAPIKEELGLGLIDPSAVVTDTLIDTERTEEIGKLK